MDNEDNIRVEDLDATQILEQQLQTYIIKVLHSESSRAEKIQNLHRIAYILEGEEEKYKKLMLDPTEDKRDEHTIGMLIALFMENEELLFQITDKWLRENDVEFNVAASRVLLALVPNGAFSPAFFTTPEDELRLVEKTMTWVRNAPYPLRVLATGLLAALVEGADISANTVTTDIPTLLLQRLSSHTPLDNTDNSSSFEPSDVSSNNNNNKRHSETNRKRSLAAVYDKNEINNGKELTPPAKNSKVIKENESINEDSNDDTIVAGRERRHLFHDEVRVPSVSEEIDSLAPPLEQLHISTERLQELERLYLLRYLSATGEYQELLLPILQCNGIDSIFFFLRSTDPYIVAEALRVVSQMCAHKKFATQFIDKGGVKLLFDIPQEPFFASPLSLVFCGLASHSAALEKACLGADSLISPMVKKAMWLLRTEYDTARKHGALFFAYAVKVRMFLDEFDRVDGPLTILKLLKSVFENWSPTAVQTTSEELHTANNLPLSKAQISVCHHVTQALRDYFRSHLVHRVDILKRKFGQSSSSAPVPNYKSLSIDDDTVAQCIQTIKQLPKYERTAKWQEVELFVNEGGVDLMLKVIEYANQSHRLNSRSQHLSEMTQFALNILHVVSAINFGQTAILNAQLEQKSAMSIIIEAAGEQNYNAPNVIIAALKLLLNFVVKLSEKRSYEKHLSKEQNVSAAATTFNQIGTTNNNEMNNNNNNNSPNVNMNENEREITASTSNFKAKKMTFENVSNELKAATKAIRSSNGISTLVSLLKYRMSIKEADTVRYYACRVLCNMAKDPTIKQILNKKVSRVLPELIREPVDRSNLSAYQQFKDSALELVQLITGRDLPMTVTETTDPTLTKLENSAIVARTPIRYSDTELLQLIYNHLQERGLHQTAQTLLNEGNLPIPKSLTRPIKRTSLKRSHLSASLFKKSPSVLKSLTPKKMSHNDEGVNFMDDDEHVNSLPESGGELRDAPEDEEENITLHKIVLQYLMDQHRQCPKPVAVVPQFSLFHKHKCPEPVKSVHTAAPFNLSARIFQRQYLPPHGGFGGRRLDRRWKFSRFRPMRKIFADEQAVLTCVALIDPGRLFMGTMNGEIISYDIYDPETIKVSEVVNNGMWGFNMTSDLRRLLSFTGFPGEMHLWDTANVSSPLHHFQSLCGDFNHANDRIVGTASSERLEIFDIQTGQLLTTLIDESRVRSKVQPTIARFSPDDHLLLAWGVLWDPRTQRPIHRFDRFTEYGDERFSPTGNEVIINSEIWDTRTFKLIKTCNALDSTYLTFSAGGEVIFAVVHALNARPFETPFTKTVRVVDAADYDLITELNLDRHVVDLSVDKNDLYIAVIENEGTMYNSSSLCRLWEIGRQRRTVIENETDSDQSNYSNMEDDNNDEDEDDDEEDEDDDDNTDDGEITAEMELEDIINEELNNGEYETSEADGSRNDNNGGDRAEEPSSSSEQNEDNHNNAIRALIRSMFGRRR